MGKFSGIIWHIIAVVVVGIWGTTFISSKVLILHGMTPAEIFVIRFIIAYAGIWIASPKKLFCDNWKDELKMFFLGVTGGSLYFLTENTALMYTQATNVSLIICTTPILTAGLCILLKKAKMTKNLAIGTVLALIGVALVIFNGKFILKLSPIGDFLTLMAASCWAAYSLTMDDIQNRYSNTFATRKVFFYGLLTILPVFIFKPWQTGLDVLCKPVIWANLLFLGVIASLVCYALWNPVMKKVGMVRASNYLYLNPAFTLVGALIFLHEKVTVISVVGTIVIILGVWIASHKK